MPAYRTPVGFNLGGLPGAVASENVDLAWHPARFTPYPPAIVENCQPVCGVGIDPDLQRRKPRCCPAGIRTGPQEPGCITRVVKTGWYAASERPGYIAAHEKKRKFIDRQSQVLVDAVLSTRELPQDDHASGLADTRTLP
jgi:hypothetical protein